MVESRSGSHHRRNSYSGNDDDLLLSPISRPDHSTLSFNDSALRPSLSLNTSPVTNSSAASPHYRSGSNDSSMSSSININLSSRLRYGEREDEIKSQSNHRAQDDRGGAKQSERSLVGTFVIVVTLLLALVGIVNLSKPTTNRQQRQLAPSGLSTYLPASFFALTGSSPDSPPPGHPIIPLISSATAKWATLLASQSKTFDRASKTYKSKYGSTPPPGFDKWFAFATQGRNHTLVDEYDSLMDDLAPYRALTPTELKRRTVELAQVPGISIVSIRNGKSQVHSKSGRWAPALAFQQMIEAFVRDLPDMDIAINEKPEGRVLPRQERAIVREEFGLDEEDISQLNITDPMKTPSLLGFKSEWSREGSVWDAFRRSCPPDSASRRLIETVRSAESSAALLVQGRASSKANLPLSRRRSTGVPLPPARELTFNQDLDAASDVCARPSIHSLHSAFFSDQRSIQYLYPVFSPSKPSGYADILIPSHHYWAPSSEFEYEWDLKKGRSKEPLDLSWEDKNDTMYWRGKVTRGADTPPGHAGSFQKQRLVKMANDLGLDQRVLVAFDHTTSSLTSTASGLAKVNEAVTDIAMACDPTLGECAYLRTLGFRVEAPEPLSEAWRHKYVLDLDEIGFSPSFFALMESNSAVIKSSMQREFWKGWVQPWKHYIPLSSSYAELYNIQAFFSGFHSALSGADAPLIINTLTKPTKLAVLPPTNDGRPFTPDRALWDIAQAGKQWKQEYVRKGDMECYVYRLMIEWAAMVNPTE